MSRLSIYPRYVRPTDNAQTNWQQKTNVLKKKGTPSETNYFNNYLTI